MENWQGFIAFLSAVMLPVAMMAGGWIVDRRAKRNAELTAKSTSHAVAVTAKEAATHEFEAITHGFTEYTERLEKQNTRLEALIEKMDARFRELDRRHRAAVDHIDLLEGMIPDDQLPRRPEAMGER